MGEGIFLSDAQRRQAVELVVDQVRGAGPGGGPSDQQSHRRHRRALPPRQQAVASAVVAIAPYFYPVDEPGLEGFYQSLAAAVPDFPIYLYNNPGRSASGIGAPLAARLHRECRPGHPRRPRRPSPRPPGEPGGLRWELTLRRQAYSTAGTYASSGTGGGTGKGFSGVSRIPSTPSGKAMTAGGSYQV